jgi:hypothetical protein
MATTTPSDFIIYEDWVQSGYIEKIAQNVAGFNANSNNAINLTTASLLGNYREIAFFKELAQSDLIHDRDKNSTAPVTAAKMTEMEDIIPYLPSRFGPYETTRSAFLDIGKSPEEFSALLGESLADAVMKDMLDTSFSAIIGAVQNLAGEPMTVGAGAAGTASLSYDSLIDGMSLYGDKINEIACFVMRAKDYFGLMKGNIVAATIDSVAGATLNSGSVATLGKPVLVIDSPSLVGAGAAPDDSGVVLALTANAITCIAADDFYLTTEQALGKANITIMWQGESQYGVDLLGYAFDKTQTIDRASIGAGANWTQVATDLKNTAGGAILTLK